MGQTTGADGLAEVVSRFFALIGLDDTCAPVYARLTHNCPATEAVLAAACDLPPENVTRAVDELVDAGFVSVSPDDPRRVSLLQPDAGLASAIVSSESAASAELDRLARVRRLAELLSTSLSDVGGQREASSFETLQDSAAVVSRLHELNHGTQDEILTCVAVRPSRGALRAARVADARLLDRGVKVRGIYLQSCRNDPATMDYLRWMTGHGAGVRLAAALPARIQIFDRRVAVVAESPAGTAPGAIVVHSAGVVDALVRLFEYAWDAAEPPFDMTEPTSSLSAQQREILWWLARGAKDDAVARHMGVSSRTVRRTISELAVELGAASRFELAVKCAQRGWLSTAGAASTGSVVEAPCPAERRFSAR